MGGGIPGDLSGDTLRGRVTATDQRRAGVTVAAAALAGDWPRADLLDILQALDLAPYLDGGRYGVDGEHETRTGRLHPTPAVATHTAPGTPRRDKAPRVIRWKAYEKCETCNLDAGLPCRAANHGRPIKYPHPGRKQTPTP